MENTKFINNAEKYLNKCFKDLSIKEIEKIKLNDNQLIEFTGNREILLEAFKNSDSVKINDTTIEIKNITFQELKESISQINNLIDDFNNFASNRKGINFF